MGLLESSPADESAAEGDQGVVGLDPSTGVSCVPPPCGRTFDAGISGSAISHRPSGTIQLHVPRPMHSPTSDQHIGHGLKLELIIVAEEGDPRMSGTVTAVSCNGQPIESLAVASAAV